MRRRRRALGESDAERLVQRDLDAMANADSCEAELGFLLTAAGSLEVLNEVEDSPQVRMMMQERVQDAEDDFVRRCVRRDRRGRGRR